jgi:hypothetical protein
MVLDMKIALCLSGQPRGLPLSIDMLNKNLVGIENMDIFLHAWFDSSMIGKPYDSAQPAQDGKVGIAHEKTEELLLDDLRPVDYIIESQKYFEWADKLRGLPDANQQKMASIFYSMYTANLIKRHYELANNFKYDLVIRTRYDMCYRHPINVLDFTELAKTHIITSEKFQGMRNDPNFLHGWYTLTDIFAFSSSENMDVFCDTYPHMEYINSQIYPPYGENYLGYRTRVMGKLPIHCEALDYEILHRVIDINTVSQ